MIPSNFLDNRQIAKCHLFGREEEKKSVNKLFLSYVCSYFSCSSCYMLLINVKTKPTSF